MSQKNLDLGRPLTYADFTDEDVFPLSEADEGCYCYECQRGQGWSLDDLAPLTRSTGVFTSKVLCHMDSPVYLCLEHIPFHAQEFESFTEDVKTQLRALRNTREKASGSGS